jgi:hypothetical protein
LDQGQEPEGAGRDKGDRKWKELKLIVATQLNADCSLKTQEPAKIEQSC